MTACRPQLPARQRPLVSVWPTGQRDDAAQLADGPYVPETARDTDRMPPAVAARVITTYTHPGDTVLDPDCGAGTVLTEALCAGRHAIGLTGNSRWWSVARANVTAAKYDGAAPDGMVLDHLPTAADELAAMGTDITLLLTTLRPAPRPRPPDNTATATATDTPAAHLAQTLTACRHLLRPGGHVVVTLRPTRQNNRPLDLAAQVHTVARSARLIPVDRCAALQAELRGDRLVVRASRPQRRHAARRERATGHPITLTAHHDVLVFRTPNEATAAAALHGPRPLLPLRHRAIDPSEGHDLLWEAA